MEKIYVITIHEVYEFENFTHKPMAFSKEEDARKEFDRLVKDAREMAGAEDYEFDLGENSASFYRVGEWPEYHYDVILEEVEVK